MRTAIVWFRRDLRVHDHPALTAAKREAERIVPVFVLDPRLLDAGRFPSANRAWFLLASLRELRGSLRARGGELFVRAGRPEAVLPELARATGADAVHFAADVSPFATARDRRVEAAVAVRRHRGNFVADADAPRTSVGRPFTVFSPFWRRCCTTRPTRSGRTGAASRRSSGPTTPTRSRHGAAGAPASRWSTRACASSRTRAGCTTARG